MSETLKQRAAISARGKTIVSASAGSGKTFVMVNRFAELASEEHVDVRHMLAVTFTNKAASQMRDRIRRALLDAAHESEKRDWMLRQLAALPLADICTIHAFCGRLIRTYFYLLDIDPAFRIISPDDAEGLAISGRALEHTFEDAYADPAYSGLISFYYRKKSDARLKDMVLSLYEAARAEAGYRTMLEKIAAGEEEKFGEAVRYLTDDFRRRAANVLSRADLLHHAAEASGGPVKEFYAEIVAAAERIADAEDLFAMREMAHGIGNAPKRAASLAEETKKLIGDLRTLCEAVKKIYEDAGKFLPRDEEIMRCNEAAKMASALAALTLRYDDYLAKIKREAGVLDYGDLEHEALKLLSMSEVKASLKYDYVFVDEYQDVNPMQERILGELAKGDVFLVGDKKQAIYGFRGSRSRYFSEKAEAYEREGNSLTLSENFRSATAVLDAVNRVFGRAMEGYERMEGGSLYREYGGEVYAYCASEEERGKQERGVYSVMAAKGRSAESAAARTVLAIVEEECGRKEGLGRQWYDPSLNDGEGGMRDVRYGDIAVLVRKNTKIAPSIVRALSEQGIPVTSSAEVNVCDLFECRILIDWLSYLDNAEQDIPMASAMLSVIGGFTEQELAAIRLATELKNYRASFRYACALYARERRGDPIAQKLESFYATAQRLRDLSRVHSASEMLMMLLAEGIEAQIAAKGESELRLAHVNRLVAESGSGETVHEFLQKLKDSDYRVDFRETGGEDAVHVLTMHAAKGLEFPVVILTELDADFRGSDYDDVLWTDAFHAALRYMDPVRKVYGDTLLRKAAVLYQCREEVEGERNLLYVAMTRACCRLHLLFDREPSCEELTYLPSDAKRLSDFLPPKALDGCMRTIELAEKREEAHAVLYREDRAHIEELVRAGAPYLFAASAEIPVKDSATGLMSKNKHTMYKTDFEEEVAPMSEDDISVADMGCASASERGTAYHAFLQYVNFGQDAGSELARMRREGLLTAEQCDLLDPKILERILAMPCFEGIERKRLFREQRFLVSLPASGFAEVYGSSTDDEVIFQGAIDLLIEENGKYTVVDYKFSQLNDRALREKYAVQLSLYRRAVSKIMRVPEEEVGGYLVNLAFGRVVSF